MALPWIIIGQGGVWMALVLSMVDQIIQWGCYFYSIIDSCVLTVVCS